MNDEPRKRLTRNAMKCHGCGDTIESKHRHDFVSCTCEALFVDGGLDYNRFGCRPGVPIENLCEWEEV
jgi:hypothetical protein